MDRRKFFFSSFAGIGGASVAGVFRTAVASGGPEVDSKTPKHFSSAPEVSRSTKVVHADHRMEYISGNSVYIEELLGSQWVGRYWNAQGKIQPSQPLWASEAFQIQIETSPIATSAASVLVSTGWQWIGSFQLPESKARARHAVVELSNKTYPVRLKIHTLLDGTPVMVRWLEVTNGSGRPIALTGLSPWSGRIWRNVASITLGYSAKWQVPWEGWFEWRGLERGDNIIKEDRGLEADDPYFILRNESDGEYCFGQLGWPEKYVMGFQKEDGVSFRIGPFADHALRVIAPGETVPTPAVHLGLMRGSFDDAVNTMHEHIRRSVLPSCKPDRSHLTQYLIPEDWPMTVYHGEEYNEANIKKCIDVAAAVGLEVFILDGPMWCSVYGDWLVPNKKHFPNGLAPIIEHAHRKGLLFGLYFELEGGRDGYCSGGVCIGKWSESEVFRKHPDWFVQTHREGKSQPVPILNLSIPAAASYLQSALKRIVQHYKLDLYRHDFNAPSGWADSETSKRDGYTESGGWRHYEAFYQILDRIHAEYPDLILQQASGDGRRLDLNSISRWNEDYDSDRETYPFMYRMLSGLSVYLTPEILVGSNGMAWPQDLPDLDTVLRGAYALGTTPVIFNGILPKSIEEFKPGVREKFLHYASIYKSFIRPLIGTCRIYHHAPINGTGGVESGDWLAMQFTSPSQGKSWATIIHLSRSDSNAYSFRPKGLDDGRRYRITSDNTGKAVVLRGSRFINDGLPIRLDRGQLSELLLIEAL
jgi:alpha-galactosidase